MERGSRDDDRQLAAGHHGRPPCSILGADAPSAPSWRGKRGWSAVADAPAAHARARSVRGPGAPQRCRHLTTTPLLPFGGPHPAPRHNPLPPPYRVFRTWLSRGLGVERCPLLVASTSSRENVEMATLPENHGFATASGSENHEHPAKRLRRPLVRQSLDLHGRQQWAHIEQEPRIGQLRDHARGSTIGGTPKAAVGASYPRAWHGLWTISVSSGAGHQSSLLVSCSTIVTVATISSHR